MDGAEEGTSCSAACEAGDTTDPRTGKWTSPNPKGHVYSAAVGMCAHLAAGIWCGVDDTDCESGIPGPYVAGDGTNGCYVGGPTTAASVAPPRALYRCRAIMPVWRPPGTPTRSNGPSCLPTRSPASASAPWLCCRLRPVTLPNGREALRAIMAPGWMTIAKNEAVLQAGLTQVLALKDLVSGKLVAQNGHQLRMAHEVEHQILAMELKLRAGIERKESRGYHYRTDVGSTAPLSLSPSRARRRPLV